MKKALLCGINSYPSPADPLEAPSEEVRRWKERLVLEYGFDSVIAPPESECDRPRVLYELRELLRNAAAKDHLLFGFWGHGGNAIGWKSDTELNNQVEHALLLYTEAAPKGFQHATITPSDIARILTDLEPTSDAQFTMIIDTCFSEKFGKPFRADGTALLNPIIVVVPRAVPDIPEDETPRTFADIQTLVGDRTIARPLILAACKEDETEVEVGEPGDRRFLFSAKTHGRLELAFAQDKKSITSHNLIDEINPLREAQHAAIVGNTGLQNELFAGGQVPRRQGLSISPPEINAAAHRASLAAETADTGQSLTIRVFGLATLIRHTSTTYPSRLILPFDTYAPTGPMNHSGFIEVAERDMPHPPSLIAPFRYPRAGVAYSRWPLTEHRVRFRNVSATTGPVQQTPAFDAAVPGLTRICPELKNEKTPHSACFYDYPIAGLFNGFVDFQTGQADVGDNEDADTEFRTRYGDIPTWRGRTAISALFTVPLAMDHAVIVLEPRSGAPIAIYVRSGSTIIIGNARDKDLNGSGSGEGPREHFIVYYNIAPITVYDPALPYRVALPVNACTITLYP